MPSHDGKSAVNRANYICTLRHAIKGRSSVIWFQNLMVRSKVMLAFATVLLVTAVLGVFAINRLSLVNDGAEKVATDYLVATDGLGDFSYGAMRYRQIQASMLLASAMDEKAAEQKQIAGALEEATKGWEEYAPTIDPGYDQNLATKMHDAWNEYIAMNDKLVQLSNAAKNEEAVALYTGEMNQAFDKFQAALQEDQNLQ